MMSFQVEVVWNREFNFSRFGSPHGNVDTAILAAQAAENMGDGERVKKARVVDEQQQVVWPTYGKAS